MIERGRHGRSAGAFHRRSAETMSTTSAVVISVAWSVARVNAVPCVSL